MLGGDRGTWVIRKRTEIIAILNVVANTIHVLISVPCCSQLILRYSSYSESSISSPFSVLGEFVVLNAVYYGAPFVLKSGLI